MQQPTQHRYSGEPTRNPLRYALAAWRLFRRDPETTTAEAGIVEIGFARSRLGRRFARWEETIETLRRHPQTRAALEARRAFGPIDLAELEALPEGTIGRVFADHCRARGIDPNLVYVPPDDEVGWLLNHLYATHDVWHVVTGWGNDLPGEVGLGAFYSAQLGAPAFFGYMSAIVFLNVVSRRADLGEIFAAFSAGWRMGQHCAPMFGIAWDELWGVPMAEIRSRFEVDRSEVVGEGIRVAA
jgi:ubiquinone biosynthesis protein Coq4